MKFRFTFGQAAAMYLSVLGFLLVVFIAGLISGTALVQEGSPSTRTETEDSSPPVVSAFPREPEPPPAASRFADPGHLDQEPNTIRSEPGPEIAIAGGSQEAKPPAPTPPATRSGEGDEQEVLLPPSVPAQEEFPPEEPDLPAAGSFTIQVAAHSTYEEAVQTLNRLQVKGFQGWIRQPQPGEADRLNRVWVGNFPSIDEARPLERQLKDAGFQTYIRRVN